MYAFFLPYSCFSLSPLPFLIEQTSFSSFYIFALTFFGQLVFREQEEADFGSELAEAKAGNRACFWLKLPSERYEELISASRRPFLLAADRKVAMKKGEGSSLLFVSSIDPFGLDFAWMDRLHKLIAEADKVSSTNAWFLTLGGASFVLNRHSSALALARRRYELACRFGREDLKQEALMHMKRNVEKMGLENGQESEDGPSPAVC